MFYSPLTDIESVAVIGNYAPRRCGLATFTTDLVESICAITTKDFCWTVAMNDVPDGYPYPDKVHFEIAEKQIDEYQRAAEFININQPDLVCVQHEYGIFGGQAGSHLLKLLAQLRAPVVTTLHTVLTSPTTECRNVILRLASLSDRLIVMSHKAVDILVDMYQIDKSKIDYIPHGIPDMPFIDPNYYKEKFGVLEKKVLLTFGLLSQNKGIEYVLKALPEVVRTCPDLVYLVLGATHPHVLKNEGDSYRLHLQQLVMKLKLEKHVRFHNRFVSLAELCEYLAMADAYITPYNDEAQITSGTLAYAMGTGNAVISTPYWHAKELLAQDRGILVPFKQPDAIRTALIDLLGNDGKRHMMRKRAYDYSRHAIWPKVAEQYLQVFDQVITDRKLRPRPYHSLPKQLEHSIFSQELPKLKLRHLVEMTDDTGLLQHARYTIPNRAHGYCTDDNARALIVIVESIELLSEASEQYESMCNRYIAFLLDAYDTSCGRFRNFLNYARIWAPEIGSEDCHGRALWALGVAVSLSQNERRLPMVSSLFKHALPATETFTSPRAIAFTLLGVNAYLDTFAGDSEAHRMNKILAEQLFGQFTKEATDDWPWLEESLHYDNASVSHALIVSGHSLANSNISQMGLTSLKWLLEVQTEEGHLVPIGNTGGYRRGGIKPRFDQQPLEAQALVDACVAAFEYTKDHKWLNHALKGFSWFLGDNDLQLPLYDAKTGGCRDGLQSTSINENQGAESTLAWLLSLCTLQRLSTNQVLFPAQRHEQSPATGSKG